MVSFRNSPFRLNFAAVERSAAMHRSTCPWYGSSKPAIASSCTCAAVEADPWGCWKLGVLAAVIVIYCVRTLLCLSRSKRSITEPSLLSVENIRTEGINQFSHPDTRLAKHWLCSTKRSGYLLPVLDLKPLWDWMAAGSVSVSVTSPMNASLQKITEVIRGRREAGNGVAAAQRQALGEHSLPSVQWTQPPARLQSHV